MDNFLSGMACGVLYGSQIITLFVAFIMRHRGYMMRASMWYLLYYFAMSTIDFILGVVWNPFDDATAEIVDVLLQSTEVVALIVYFYKVVYARSMPLWRIVLHSLPYLLFAVLIFMLPHIDWEPWIVATVDVQGIGCLIYGYTRLRYYHRTLANYSSSTSGTELRWIKLLTPLLVLLIATWNVPTVATDSIWWNMAYNLASAVIIVLLFYAVLRHTLTQDEILHNWDLIREERRIEHLSADELKALLHRPRTYTKPSLLDFAPRSEATDSSEDAATHNCEECPVAATCERATTRKDGQGHANESNSSRTTADRSTPAGELEWLMCNEKLYLNSELTLADLAVRLGTNVTYMSQYFNKVLSTTFYEYVNGYRLRDAERMLLTTNATLDVIAAKSGFNSQTSFYRYFKKVHDKTPTAFRRQAESK